MNSFEKNPFIHPHNLFFFISQNEFTEVFLKSSQSQNNSEQISESANKNGNNAVKTLNTEEKAECESLPLNKSAAVHKANSMSSYGSLPWKKSINTLLSCL